MARSRRIAASAKTVSKKLRAARLCGSLLLLPLVAVQGGLTRRRVPRLPSAKAPHHGATAGRGPLLRLLAIGESSISGVGLATGEETVAATTARSLTKMTNRSVAWRAHGLTGATVREGLDRLLPALASEPADVVIVGFGVNDAMAYRSPSRFADDLETLVRAVRERVGEAVVVI